MPMAMVNAVLRSLAVFVFRLLGKHLAGWRKTSTYGSNLRRLFSRGAALICTLLALYFSIPSVTGPPSLLTGVSLVLLSTVFFTFVVVSIPFLTSQNFRPNPIRLIFDTLISGSLAILSFAMLYSLTGIDGGENPSLCGQGPARSMRDYVYFSAVTFSTLGYGDFAPCPGQRLWAAFQAIFGNLHLGMIVGAAFFAAQRNDPRC